jgi:hypothetical protein
MHVASVGEPNKHFIFRRLHSQQLRVPFRIFLRFVSDSALVSPSSAGVLRDVTARGADIASMFNAEALNGTKYGGGNNFLRW